MNNNKGSIIDNNIINWVKKYLLEKIQEISNYT